MGEAEQQRPEDRSRGERSGEGWLSALRALRRDERRRRNQYHDSRLPSDVLQLEDTFGHSLLPLPPARR